MNYDDNLANVIIKIIIKISKSWNCFEILNYLPVLQGFQVFKLTDEAKMNPKCEYHNVWIICQAPLISLSILQ